MGPAAGDGIPIPKLELTISDVIFAIPVAFTLVVKVLEAVRLSVMYTLPST